MPDINLTLTEANELIAIAKHRAEVVREDAP